MELPELIRRYLNGSLRLNDRQAAQTALSKVSAYRTRLLAIRPRTDLITDLLSLLLDMQDYLSQTTNPNPYQSCV